MKKIAFIFSIKMNNSPLMSEMKNGELAGMFVVCNFVRLYNQMQKKKTL